MWEEHEGTCLNIYHVGAEAGIVGYQREAVASLWYVRVTAAEEHQETVSAIRQLVPWSSQAVSIMAVLSCGFGRIS